MAPKTRKQGLKFKYNPQWAYNISQNLLGKYTRAAEILGEETGIKMHQIWIFLATNSPKWVQIRMILQKSNIILLKLGEDWLRASIRTCPTTHLYSGLEYEGIKLPKFDSSEDLTELNNWLSLKGQGFRGS